MAAGIKRCKPQKRIFFDTDCKCDSPTSGCRCICFYKQTNEKLPQSCVQLLAVVISLLMTIGIVFYMRYPHTQLPFFAWIAYGLDLLASLLFLVFSLGKTQKCNKILSTIIFIFGILSVLFSVLLSLFVYPRGEFCRRYVLGTWRNTRGFL